MPLAFGLLFLFLIVFCLHLQVETTFDSIKDLSADSKASIRKAFGGLVPFIVQRLSVFEEELKER
jgi:hypothetical protein